MNDRNDRSEKIDPKTFFQTGLFTSMNDRNDQSEKILSHLGAVVMLKRVFVLWQSVMMLECDLRVHL